MKYKDWLNEWLAVYVRPVAKERTLEKYERICRLRIIPALGEYEIEELSPFLLQKFITGLAARYAPNSVKGTISVLKSSLKQATVAGYLSKQITEGIIRPRMEERPAECFSEEEQRKIEKFITKSTRTKLVGVLLCLYTGLSRAPPYLCDPSHRVRHGRKDPLGDFGAYEREYHAGPLCAQSHGPQAEYDEPSRQTFAIKNGDFSRKKMYMDYSNPCTLFRPLQILYHAHA